MSFTHRAKRTLALAAGGAMVLGLMPAGAAFADRDDVCENAPENVFNDVSPSNIHSSNIDCIAAYDIVVGVGGGNYNPAGDVRRDQMATYLVNLAEAALQTEFEVPDDSPFTDIAGNTHEDNIKIAYELGITSGRTATTYDPGSDVRRDQMATFIAQAHEALGVEWTDDPDEPFEDVDGNTHELNINRLADAGLVLGVSEGQYNPTGDVRRDQMATFIANSAGYLDELEIWEAPRLPGPDPETNQVFEVTPDDDVFLPQGDDRDFAADVSAGTDADELVIQLADADNVDISDGVVTFDADDDDAADFGDVDNTVITDVEVDGVGITDSGERVVVSGPADDVSFTVDHEGDVESVVAVVYEPGDDGELSVDSDGAPEADFGVSGATTFADVNTIATDPVADLNAYGTEHTVTGTLATDWDEDGQAVELEGETIDFMVIDQGYTPAGAGSSFAAQSEDAVSPWAEGLDQGDVAAECPYTDSNAIPVGAVVTTGSATTDAAGSASFSYTMDEPGPNALTEDVNDTGEYSVDEHCILAEWEAQDGAYEEDEQEATGVAYKLWTDLPGTVGLFIELEPEESFNAVGGNHAVTATVQDLFGNAVAGEDIDFTVDRDFTGERDDQGFTFTRTTNADGEATLTYSGPSVDSALDEVEASWTGEIFGEEDTQFSQNVVNKYWVLDAEDGDVDAAAIIGGDLDSNYVYVVADNDDGDWGVGDYLRFDYTLSDLYEVQGDGVTAAEWVEELSDVLDDESTNDSLGSTNWDQAGTTTLNLQ